MKKAYLIKLSFAMLFKGLEIQVVNLIFAIVLRLKNLPIGGLIFHLDRKLFKLRNDFDIFERTYIAIERSIIKELQARREKEKGQKKQ